MQIEIVSVDNQKTKTYFTLQVTYRDFRGDTKNWKLMSFSNPASYAVLKDAKPGERYEITTGKNEKDYTVWTSATKVDAGQATPAGSPANTKTAWVPDNERQRLIVKQSSLGHAINYVSSFDAHNYTPEGIMELADKFVAWVFDDKLEVGAE